MVHIRIAGIDDAVKREVAIQEVQRAYSFAFDRLNHAIREVDVFVSDVNGPKGGNDKVCRVQMRLMPRGTLTAKSRSASVIQAAREAFSKTKALLTRKLSKKRKSYPNDGFFVS